MQLSDDVLSIVNKLIDDFFIEYIQIVVEKVCRGRRL